MQKYVFYSISYSVPLSIEATGTLLCSLTSAFQCAERLTISGINDFCEQCSRIVQIHEKCTNFIAVKYSTDCCIQEVVNYKISMCVSVYCIALLLSLL